MQKPKRMSQSKFPAQENVSNREEVMYHLADFI